MIIKRSSRRGFVCKAASNLTPRRVQPSVNVPYAIPDPNVVRRVVGYAISIKGGLKVRNPTFVEECAAAVVGPGTLTAELAAQEYLI